MPLWQTAPSSTQHPFCDIFKYGTPPYLARTSDGVSWSAVSMAFGMQDNGFPGWVPPNSNSLLYAVSFLIGPDASVTNRVYPLGLYECFFKGTAYVWFSGGGAQVLANSSNYYRLNLTSSASFLTVRIGRLNQSDPLTDMYRLHQETGLVHLQSDHIK